jgi:hypothetical protein
MEKLYRNYRDSEYVRLRARYEPNYKERNERLLKPISYMSGVERFLSDLVVDPKCILDWGGDTGLNTPFKSQRQKLFVYDISDKDVLPGAERVDERSLLTHSYNLIVCMNVLEHIPFPRGELKKLYKLMSRETVLYIEVPLEELIRTGENNPHLKKKHWHEHINFFSEKSLLLLLKSEGFRIKRLSRLQTVSGSNEEWVWQVACCLD